MAAGDTLATFVPQSNQPPSSAFATPDRRNAHAVLDFDAAADESAIFPGILPSNYSGGGLTVIVMWSATSAVAGDVRIDAAIERLEDEGTDTDADSFAAVQSVTATAPGTSGALQYSTITFTAGAQMDSLAAGEAYRLKITRDADHAADTMAGDMEIHRVLVKQT